MRVGIIGGSGFYTPGFVAREEEVTVSTPYGEVALVRGWMGEKEVFFLARHGKEHTVPPHRVNYRANIWALKEVGVAAIIATAAVGSLRPALAPGEFFLPDQFLDFTKGRPQTFYEGGPKGVVHVDMTRPYCPRLGGEIRAAGEELGIPVRAGGTYVCTEGPRFETPAEIRMFSLLGGDVVGMTGVPEVVLAREAGICYASIAVVTNYAAGLASSALTHEEVLTVMAGAQERLRLLISETVRRLRDYECPCRAPKEGI